MDDFKEVVFSRCNSAVAHINSLWLRQHVCYLHARKKSPNMEQSRHEILPLAEELLAFENFWEREKEQENFFKVITCKCRVLKRPHFK